MRDDPLVKGWDSLSELTGSIVTSHADIEPDEGRRLAGEAILRLIDEGAIEVFVAGDDPDRAAQAGERLSPRTVREALEGSTLATTIWAVATPLGRARVLEAPDDIRTTWGWSKDFVPDV